jgi:hypothetical protein
MSATEHLRPEQFFHGTTRPNLTEITPADRHPTWMKPVFENETDRGHAYATTDESNAWHYAQLAHNTAVHRSRGGPFPVPRVYQVEPMGEHETDPEYDGDRHRGNFSTDRRSRHGWRVVREMPMPEHMGEPDDWRH